SMPVNTGIVAGPITYELDGVQYVAVTSGNNQNGGFYSENYSRILVFKLGGTATLPPAAPVTPPPFNPPAQTATPAVIERGGQLYAQNCAQCHGANVGQTASFPDLRRGTFLQDKAYFHEIVRQGALLDNGMGNFSAVLDAAGADAIFAYIVDRSIAARD